MEKFVVMIEEMDELIFHLRDGKIPDLETRINIINENGTWTWKLHAGVGRWNPVKIVDKKFDVELYEDLEDTILHKIRNIFYELFRQLKSHPAYRLKLINMLNDETREIWKVV